MIEIVTLENVLTDNIYNDLGFTVGDRLLILVEAQSTWSVNIIVRALLYLAQTYHDYVVKRGFNLYGKRKISIPKPELFVIYTGEQAIDKDSISLSEEFFGGEPSDLEITVHVLTDGKKGDILYQYVAFTKVLDEQVRLHGRTLEAIQETVRICKEHDILKEYLSEHEQEVRNIMISLFDNDQIVEAYSKERYEEGLAEGRTEGRAEGLTQGRAEGLTQGRAEGLTQGRAEGEKHSAIETAKKMLKEALPIDLILRISGLSSVELDALMRHG